MFRNRETLRKSLGVYRGHHDPRFVIVNHCPSFLLTWKSKQYSDQNLPQLAS